MQCYQGKKTWFKASAAMSMRSAILCVTKQRRVVILYRRFGTTYRSYIQQTRSPGREVSWTSWPLKMGPIRCPETSTQNYHSTLRRAQISGKDVLNSELYIQVKFKSLYAWQSIHHAVEPLVRHMNKFCFTFGYYSRSHYEASFLIRGWV
jgi:hypothetical protein